MQWEHTHNNGASFPSYQLTDNQIAQIVTKLRDV